MKQLYVKVACAIVASMLLTNALQARTLAEVIYSVLSKEGVPQKKYYTFYDVLGVNHNASSKEIDAAAKRLIALYHPDKAAGKGGSKGDYSTVFRIIQEARRILTLNKTRYNEQRDVFERILKAYNDFLSSKPSEKDLVQFSDRLAQDYAQFNQGPERDIDYIKDLFNDLQERVRQDIKTVKAGGIAGAASEKIYAEGEAAAKAQREAEAEVRRAEAAHRTAATQAEKAKADAEKAKAEEAKAAQAGSPAALAKAQEKTKKADELALVAYKKADTTLQLVNKAHNALVAVNKANMALIPAGGALQRPESPMRRSRYAQIAAALEKMKRREADLGMTKDEMKAIVANRSDASVLNSAIDKAWAHYNALVPGGKRLGGARAYNLRELPATADNIINILSTPQ